MFQQNIQPNIGLNIQGAYTTAEPLGAGGLRSSGANPRQRGPEGHGLCGHHPCSGRYSAGCSHQFGCAA